MFRASAAVLAIFSVLVGVVTWMALELGDVAVVHTSDGDGSVRDTRVWFVESDGRLLLEAGSPANPWVQDLTASSSLALTRSEIREGFVFRIAPEPGGHEEIRALMREKYGQKDGYV